MIPARAPSRSQYLQYCSDYLDRCYVDLLFVPVRGRTGPVQYCTRGVYSTVLYDRGIAPVPTGTYRQAPYEG